MRELEGGVSVARAPSTCDGLLVDVEGGGGEAIEADAGTGAADGPRSYDDRLRESDGKGERRLKLWY